MNRVLCFLLAAIIAAGCATTGTKGSAPKNDVSNPADEGATKGTSARDHDADRPDGPTSSATALVTMTVVAAKASIRRMPLKDAKVVTTVPKGANVRIIQQRDDWFQVEYREGKTGWCHKSALAR